MILARDDGEGALELLQPEPPPPPWTPPPPPPAPAPIPPPTPPPPPPAAPLVNGNGETLEQAEAAVRAEVAAGALPAVALANHPLPAGAVTTEQALSFLASLPQSVTPIGDAGAGTVTGPPVASLPTSGPPGSQAVPTAENPPAEPSVDVGGTGGGGRTVESAYRPPGVVAAWRVIVDVFRNGVPDAHHQVNSAALALKEVFR